MYFKVHFWGTWSSFSGVWHLDDEVRTYALPSHTHIHMSSHTTSHTSSHTTNHTSSYKSSHTSSYIPSHTSSYIPSHTSSYIPSHTNSSHISVTQTVTHIITLPVTHAVRGDSRHIREILGGASEEQQCQHIQLTQHQEGPSLIRRSPAASDSRLALMLRGLSQPHCLSHKPTRLAVPDMSTTHIDVCLPGDGIELLRQCPMYNSGNRPASPCIPFLLPFHSLVFLTAVSVNNVNILNFKAQDAAGKTVL